MSSRMAACGMIVVVCVVLVLSSVLYVFHGARSELDDVRHRASSCTHHLESVSSQLHVVDDYKFKLERLLENEKRKHVSTQYELNQLLEEEKQLRYKQNVDSMNRYNEIKRVHKALQDEEKKIREELEALKLKYQEIKKINEKLVQNLNAALNEFQNEKAKLEGVIRNTDNELNNNLQKSNELLDTKPDEKPSDNINASKLILPTPAINPQSLYGATAKSSTPMLNSATPAINPQPLYGPTTKSSTPMESKVGGNESTKAMPPVPQEDTDMIEKFILMRKN